MANKEFFAADITGNKALMDNAASIISRAYQGYSQFPKTIEEVNSDLLKGYCDRKYSQIAAFTEPEAKGEMVGTVMLVYPPKLELLQQFTPPSEININNTVEIARLAVQDHHNTFDIFHHMWEKVKKIINSNNNGCNLVAIMPAVVNRIVNSSGIETNIIDGFVPSDCPEAINIRQEYPGYWNKKTNVYSFNYKK